MTARRLHRPADAPNEGVRRLRILRSKLSPAQLARCVGCSERQMRRWISGESTPEAEWREALQEARTPSGEPFAIDAETAWTLVPGDSAAATLPRLLTEPGRS